MLTKLSHLLLISPLAILMTCYQTKQSVPLFSGEYSQDFDTLKWDVSLAPASQFNSDLYMRVQSNHKIVTADTPTGRIYPDDVVLNPDSLLAVIIPDGLDGVYTIDLQEFFSEWKTPVIASPFDSVGYYCLHSSIKWNPAWIFLEKTKVSGGKIRIYPCGFLKYHGEPLLTDTTTVEFPSTERGLFANAINGYVNSHKNSVAP